MEGVKVVIAGGGTGGHLYPGIALARAIQARIPGSEIYFMGTKKGIESRILPREGYPLKTIDVEGLVGKKWTDRVRSIFRFPLGLFQSFLFLKSYRPDLVVGVGGYASGPVLLTASLLGIRRVILEQNVIPGLTNRVLARLVHKIFGAFDGSRDHFPPKKFFHSGNPVRKEIRSGSEKKEEGNVILVFGGSQGAHAINSAVIDALPLIGRKEGFRWIHQTGPADLERVSAAYASLGIPARVEPFIFDMATAYSEADLVICRAGATTLAELTACGKPALLIPFPLAAHNHQEENALYLERIGAAEVILQRNLSGKVLAGRVEAILSDTEKRSAMAARMRSLEKKEASETIIEECLRTGLIHV